MHSRVNVTAVRLSNPCCPSAPHAFPRPDGPQISCYAPMVEKTQPVSLQYLMTQSALSPLEPRGWSDILVFIITIFTISMNGWYDKGICERVSLCQFGFRSTVTVRALLP